LRAKSDDMALNRIKTSSYGKTFGVNTCQSLFPETKQTRSVQFSMTCLLTLLRLVGKFSDN